jgi:hypothetical protein
LEEEDDKFAVGTDLQVCPSLGGGAKMGDRDSTTRFGIGFLLGAAVGLGLAFLFTPKSGKETREFLKDKFSSIPDSIKAYCRPQEGL